MAAPLIAAASYFGLPRLLGYLADQAAVSRRNTLLDQAIAEQVPFEDRGKLLQNDPYLIALGMVPRRSGVEELIGDARMLYNASTAPVGPVEASPDSRTIEEILAGRGLNDPNVQPGVYVERNGQFLTPMDDFLRYGGRDDDAGGRYFQAPSYGQTDQPATEVRFDQPPGGADGGLAALIRRPYA